MSFNCAALSYVEAAKFWDAKSAEFFIELARLGIRANRAETASTETMAPWDRKSLCVYHEHEGTPEDYDCEAVNTPTLVDPAQVGEP